MFQVSNQQTAACEKSDSFLFFIFPVFLNLHVYYQLNTAGSETPEQLNTVSLISDQGDISVVKSERPRHPGEHVQQHKNSRFQLLSIVCTKRHQSKRQHNMKTDERNSLIKIPCVMLSVDYFIYKSILYTTIKGCNFKMILQCIRIFSRLFLKIQLTLLINKRGKCII